MDGNVIIDSHNKKINMYKYYLMNNNLSTSTVYMSLEKHCDKITESKYFKKLSDGNLMAILLSVANLKKVLHDYNLLLAVNVTKVEDNKCIKKIVEILHKKTCVNNNAEKFQEFLCQFDVTTEYIKKNSSIVPYDVLVNELSKQTLDNIWQQSVASLATTDYILSMIIKKINQHADETQIKLDESCDALEIVKMLDSEIMYTYEIEKGITETIKSFTGMFEVLGELFFDEFENWSQI